MPQGLTVGDRSFIKGETDTVNRILQGKDKKKDASWLFLSNDINMNQDKRAL